MNFQKDQDIVYMEHVNTLNSWRLITRYKVYTILIKLIT